MLNLRLSEIAVWTRGHLSGVDGTVRGVAIDTRRLGGGELFVALRGERHDAHEFVADAAAAGAAAALVERRVDAPLPQILVADTQLALGDLAAAVRARRRAQVIGITGSNGKTTVKTLLGSILKRHARTHVNAGNLNNEIGLPLTLLSMPEDTEYAVLEMGAGKPGDIEYLAAIARPHVALVNNIAAAHLERLGSIDGVAQTKGALYSALPGDGVAVINADDAYAEQFAVLAGTRRILRFGLDNLADVTASGLTYGEHTQFSLETPVGRSDIHLPLPGRHNVMNALAASAIATALSVPLATIRDGLSSAVAVAGRLVSTVHPDGWTLIDDSYNANPGSTAAAIQTLVMGLGPAWLVLGDMRELGHDSAQLHAQIGHFAKAQGIERLYTVGDLALEASSAFGAGACHYSDQSELIAALRAQLAPGVRCLVKGSRSAAMDRVVAALLHSGGNTHVV